MTLNDLTMSSTFCVTVMEDQETAPSPGLPWVKVGSRPPTLNYILQMHNYLILKMTQYFNVTCTQFLWFCSFLLCVWVFCLYVSALHTFLKPMEAREGGRSPGTGTGISVNCKLPCECWASNLDLQKEQPVLSTAKPSFQLSLYIQIDTLQTIIDFICRVIKMPNMTRMLNKKLAYSFIIYG